VSIQQGVVVDPGRVCDGPTETLTIDPRVAAYLRASRRSSKVPGGMQQKAGNVVWNRSQPGAGDRTDR
jgi:hypothetical protein